MKSGKEFHHFHEQKTRKKKNLKIAKYVACLNSMTTLLIIHLANMNDVTNHNLRCYMLDNFSNSPYKKKLEPEKLDRMSWVSIFCEITVIA